MNMAAGVSSEISVPVYAPLHLKGKGKFCPIRVRESLEGEYIRSSTLSLTSALDGMGD
jgi:hypothetical protein